MKFHPVDPYHSISDCGKYTISEAKPYFTAWRYHAPNSGKQSVALSVTRDFENAMQACERDAAPTETHFHLTPDER
jgi:predicted secreted protein